jgi:hypothetical protein
LFVLHCTLLLIIIILLLRFIAYDGDIDAASTVVFICLGDFAVDFVGDSVPQGPLAYGI